MAANPATLDAPAGRHHGTDGPVAHHFNNMRQQQATVRFGMWLFLVTEVLFFGGAFCAYTCYRVWFPREFEAGSAALNVGIALANTLLLLTSSMTCTLAIRAAYMGRRNRITLWLVTTIALAVVFLGLKSREYYLDYEEGLLPTTKTVVDHVRQDDGTYVDVETTAFEKSLRKVLAAENARHPAVGIDIDKVNVRRVQLFFLFYYVVTGLHVVHMIIGVGLLTWQTILSRMGFFDHSARYVYIEVMSLYWHFVDMVWMFVVPLLYLAGPHTLTQAVEQFKLAVGLAAGGHH